MNNVAHATELIHELKRKRRDKIDRQNFRTDGYETYYKRNRYFRLRKDVLAWFPSRTVESCVNTLFNGEVAKTTTMIVEFTHCCVDTRFFLSVCLWLTHSSKTLSTNGQRLACYTSLTTEKKATVWPVFPCDWQQKIKYEHWSRSLSNSYCCCSHLNE